LGGKTAKALPEWFTVRLTDKCEFN